MLTQIILLYLVCKFNLPFHREMDEIREDAAGKSKIGTTRRGIGPAYEDKVGRRSIRVMDLRSEKI